MINFNDFQYVQKLIHTHSAFKLPDDQQYLVESRLLSIAKKIGFDSVSELIYKLKQKSFNSLHWEVVEAMMITETMFFRDIYPFKALKTIIRELINKRKIEYSLNIWSSACSTGQEPYSITILLKEHFTELNSWKVSMIASDISHQIG